MSVKTWSIDGNILGVSWKGSRYRVFFELERNQLAIVDVSASSDVKISLIQVDYTTDAHSVYRENVVNEDHADWPVITSNKELMQAIDDAVKALEDIGINANVNQECNDVYVLHGYEHKCCLLRGHFGFHEAVIRDGNIVASLQWYNESSGGS